MILSEYSHTSRVDGDCRRKSTLASLLQNGFARLAIGWGEPFAGERQLGKSCTRAQRGTSETLESKANSEEAALLLQHVTFRDITSTRSHLLNSSPTVIGLRSLPVNPTLP